MIFIQLVAEFAETLKASESKCLDFDALNRCIYVDFWFFAKNKST